MRNIESYILGSCPSFDYLFENGFTFLCHPEQWPGYAVNSIYNKEDENYCSVIFEEGYLVFMQGWNSELMGFLHSKEFYWYCDYPNTIYSNPPPGYIVYNCDMITEEELDNLIQLEQMKFLEGNPKKISESTLLREFDFFDVDEWKAVEFYNERERLSSNL